MMKLYIITSIYIFEFCIYLVLHDIAVGQENESNVINRHYK